MSKPDMEQFGGPKRPPASAWMLFLQLNRSKLAKELGITQFRQMVSAAAERWEKIDEIERSIWQNQATALKEQYDTDMQAFKKTSGYRRYTEALKNFETSKARKEAAKPRPREEAVEGGKEAEEQEKGKKAKCILADREPKRPPMTAFVIWANAEGRALAKAKSPSSSFGEMMRITGDIWKQMADKQQQWEDKAKEARAQYKRDIAAFKEGRAKASQEGGAQEGKKGDANSS
eukprot:TRINITY_DN7935_c0_g2_i1.p1 TRINITY_DN7935_c0_g2~~TRINITY_DN7935_c0_g2_i1.p1  ORF type:complete len:254 (+),score=107.25 TRINITY_DN7935_c0_g2_i1:68-763(+)